MLKKRPIDITRLLEDVPPLSQLSGTCVSGWAAGATFTVDEDTAWEATGYTVATRLDAIPQEDITIETALGPLTLRRPAVTRLTLRGPVEGIAVSVSLRMHSTASVPARRFRSYVSVREFEHRVLWPAIYTDEQLGFQARAHLPLSLADGSLDVLWVPQGSVLILEAPAEVAPNSERFAEVCGAARMLFSYLFGVRLDGPSQTVHLGDRDQVLEVEWYSGRAGGRDTFYKPIPVSWSEWHAASEALGLDRKNGPLVPAVIARMVQAVVDAPDLRTPLEYLLRFHEVPVEMRGAFLAVALESLTDHLKKQGLFTFDKPMSDEAWSSFCADLMGVVDARPDWEPSQRTVIASRLRNLNSPTNAAKLTRPFTALGVDLTPDEHQAIKERNRLLHRGRLLSAQKARDDREAWKSAYVTEMRMYTAINKLLLTHLGFEGAVIDWGALPFGAPPTIYRQLPANGSSD